VAAPVHKLSRQAHRRRIHVRTRKTLVGTAERPRLCVHRTSKHIRAQVVDDQTNRTIVSASSLDGEVRKSIKGGGNIAAAKWWARPSRNARKPRASTRWFTIEADINITGV